MLLLIVSIFCTLASIPFIDRLLGKVAALTFFLLGCICYFSDVSGIYGVGKRIFVEMQQSTSEYSYNANNFGKYDPDIEFVSEMEFRESVKRYHNTHRWGALGILTSFFSMLSISTLFFIPLGLGIWAKVNWLD